MRNITLIPGDGIGPEITESVIKVAEAADAQIKWEIMKAGQEAVELYGCSLPDEVIESIKRNKVALKGPVATQIGKGFKSVNVSLRQKLNLYANIRPVRTLPGIDTPYKDVDLVIFRENTEDLYAGIEHVIDENRVEAIKIITREASRKIAAAAFDYAANNNRKKVTCIHKANIMKLSDGMFIEEVRNVSKGYEGIEYNEMIVDNACMKLVRDPGSFDVIVTENLYGDIISDLCAGLAGGLGEIGRAHV